MSNTTNLDLEEITVDDRIKDTFINKLNSNLSKIDNAYGTLKTKLIDTTMEPDLNSAIEKYNTFTDEISELKNIGNANSNDILVGKTALVQGETITGTLKPIKIETIVQTINENSTNAQRTYTFIFSENITNARILYQAFNVDTSNVQVSDNGRYTLLNYDTDSANANVYCSCLYSPGRTYYSYVYSVSKNNFTFSKNGNILTITPIDNSYDLCASIGTIKARVTAIIE